MKLQGDIISGEFNQLKNEFYLQRVKHFTTNSTLNENQLKTLYDYLNKHKNEADGQILTLYDQMPVRLSQEEINQLMNELDKIKNWFHE
ncbi:MAG: hypothetical protein H0Z31_12465 [Bacillus sp. (in: Bacteria)]|jgi:uncharacterized protein YneF (UPF0154 family)|nr:hypothetical protein [Bacillus sp. (in: firmicutes)]